MAETEEQLGKLLKENGINDNTAVLLADQGFVSVEALDVLDVEDIPTLKIKQLAQRKLLEKMISKQQSRQGKDATDNHTSRKDKDMYMDATVVQSTRRLDAESARDPMLGHQTNISRSDINRTQTGKGLTGSSLPQPQSHTLDDSVRSFIGSASASPNHDKPGTAGLSSLGINPMTCMRGDLNPLVYLSDNKNCEYLDITDFVPSSYYEEDEQILSSQEGSEIVLKTGPRKVKLEKVNQMQWSAASCRILAKLLLEGKLGLEAVAQYLAYSVKISGLAQRYVWSTVMLYDREYRRAQATYNFPWGSDVPHLSSVHLIVKHDKDPMPPGKKSDTKDTFKTIQGAGRAYRNPYPCNLYNSDGNCKYGANCRFLHQCTKCKGPHPGSEHK